MIDGVFRRRRLPHWDVDDATYFVTTCLAGSIPAQGRIRLNELRQKLEIRPRPDGMTTMQWDDHKHKLVFAQFDNLLDMEPAVRHLENSEAASEVENCVRHFAGDRYDLLAYVVMPSHFHMLFHPRSSWIELLVEKEKNTGKPSRRTPRQQIMKSVKGYSAFRCNRLLGLSRTFWQDESYDHVVRDEDELFRIIDYIESNPVKASLVRWNQDWLWSSADDRIRLRVPFGLPLPARQMSALEQNATISEMIG